MLHHISYVEHTLILRGLFSTSHSLRSSKMRVAAVVAPSEYPRMPWIGCQLCATTRYMRHIWEKEKRPHTYLDLRICINYFKQPLNGFLETRDCVWWLIPHQGPDGSFCIRAFRKLADSFHNVEGLGSVVVHEPPEVPITKVIFESRRGNCFSSPLGPDKLSIAPLLRLSHEWGKLNLKVLLVMGNISIVIVVRTQCLEKIRAATVPLRFQTLLGGIRTSFRILK